LSYPKLIRLTVRQVSARASRFLTKAAIPRRPRDRSLLPPATRARIAFLGALAAGFPLLLGPYAPGTARAGDGADLRPARLLARETVPPESLRAVVVTIDGIRKSEFIRWSRGLQNWILEHGAFLPDVVNLTRGITDPNHAIIWGSGDPGMCRNSEGHPAQPMHFELLRAQRNLPRSAVAIVSGKFHLVDTNVHSAHPDYGPRRAATTILVQTDPPDGLSPMGAYEGPDSLIMAAALRHLSDYDVQWMGINLSEYDLLGHWPGMYLCEWDSTCYWQRLHEVYLEAEHQITDVLWPFLESHPRYAGRTLLVVMTDHGRHLDHVAGGHLEHGHGWNADSTACVRNCPGCRDIWAMFAGPGIKRGYVSPRTYAIEDIGPTLRALMGFENPCEAGWPMHEILVSLPRSGSAPDASGTVRMLDCRARSDAGGATIGYELIAAGPLALDIYQVDGRALFSRRWSEQRTGRHEFYWDGRDDKGRRLCPGIYFVRLDAPRGSALGRVLLVH